MKYTEFRANTEKNHALYLTIDELSIADESLGFSGMLMVGIISEGIQEDISRGIARSDFSK